MVNLFENAKKKLEEQKQYNKIMNQKQIIKQLPPLEQEKIKQKHWNFLDKYEKLMLEADFFSAKEKHEILTEMQNRLDFCTESEIYVETRKLYI